MKQVLRFFILVGFIAAPFIGNASVTAHFTSNYTPGCGASLATPISVTFTDNSTTSGGTIIYHSFTVDSVGIGGILFIKGSGTTSPYTYNFTSTGTFEVIDTVVNSLGDTSVYTQNYIFSTQPHVGFTTSTPALDTHACPGHVVTFQNLSQTIPGCTPAFTWNIYSSTGLIATFTTSTVSATITYTFTTPGQYNVYLGEFSCSPYVCDSFSFKGPYITIDTLPVACFTNNDSTPCNTPAIVDFTNCSVGATHYTWHFGDGSTSTAVNPSHTYTSTGTIKDTLIAYSEAGCPNTKIDSANIIVSNFTPVFTVSATSICQSNSITSGTVTVTDGTTGATTHSWTDNYVPAHSSTAASPTFTYATPGTYTITETVGNVTGCSGTISHTITVNAAPVAAFTSDTVYRCTPNLTANYTSTVTPAGSLSSEIWHFGDGGTATIPSPTHIYTATGTYTNTLTVTGTNGCSSQTVRASYIKIGAPTFANAIAVDSGCVPFPMAYTTSISSPVGATYTVTSMNFGDGTTTALPGISGTHTYTAGGVYTVTTHYTLDPTLGGCSYTNTVTVTVGTVHPIFTPTISADTICPASTLTVTGNCSNCTSFRWNFGDGSPTVFSHDGPTLWDTTHFYGPTDAHIYTLTAIANDAGCTDTSYLTVDVAGPQASFTAAINNCSLPTTVSFAVATADTLATGFSDATGFHWDFGDGTTGTGINPSHTYTTTGATYTVTLVDSATTGTHHCFNNATLVVHVYPLLDTFHIADTVICHGSSAAFTGPLTPYGGNYSSYTWRFGDGSAPSVVTTSNATTHIYTANGTYLSSLVIKNTFGCTDSAVATSHITVTGPAGSISASTVLGCDTLSVTFTDNNSDLAGYTINHTWLFNGPPAVAGSGIPTTPVAVATTTVSETFPEGTYHVILYDTDSNPHHCYTSDTVVIRSQKPHAYFYSPDSTIQACIGIAIPFHDTNTNCTYSWNFGDGSTGTGQNPTHVYTANGTYSVTVTITTTAGGTLPVGCTDTYTSPYSVVVANVNPSFTLSTNYSPCPSGTPVFGTNTTTPLGAYTYQWNVYPYGEAVPGIGSNFFDVLYQTTAIELTATSPIGCVGVVYDTFTVGGISGNITVSNDSGCNPVTSTFTFNNTSTVTPSSFQWLPGDGSSYTTSSPVFVYTYTVAGTFHPSVIIGGGGCTGITFPSGSEVAHTDSVQVFPIPTVTVTPNQFICYGGTANLNATGAGPGGTYVWSPTTALTPASGPAVVAAPSLTTTYTVTGTTIHTCFDTAITTVTVDTPINITITGRDSVCGNLCDTLTAHGGTGSNYTWSPSTDLGTTTGATVVSCPNTVGAGALPYKAVYTDLLGCKDSATFTVNINPLPGTITGVFKECAGDTVQVSDIPASGMWSSSDSAVAAIDAGGNVGGESAGSATITYATGAGCIATHTFTVTPAPGPIKGITEVCINATSILTDTVVGGTWSSTQTAVATVSNGTPTIHTTVGGVGTGTTTVTYTLGDGCAASTVVTTEPLPVPYLLDSPVVCRWSSGTTLTANAGEASYLWTPNIFITPSNTVQAPTFHDTANLVYTLTETSIFGCVDSIKIPVTVYDSAFTSVSNDTIICRGLSAHLQAYSSSDTVTNDQTKWLWSPGSSLSNDAINDPIATPDSTTTYTVQITENPCYSATREVTVTVIQIPDIAITETMPEPMVAGSSDGLSASIINGVVVSSWAWMPSDATVSCDTCPTTIVTPTNSTTYTVSATTPIGCVGYGEITVNLICKEMEQVFVPNTFTPNGDGNNDRFYLSGKGLGKITRMSVYNRWGEEVFHAEGIDANTPAQGWDGTYRGQILEPDVFVYVIELLCEVNNVPFTIKGDISLVR